MKEEKLPGVMQAWGLFRKPWRRVGKVMMSEKSVTGNWSIMGLVFKQIEMEDADLKKMPGGNKRIIPHSS